MQVKGKNITLDNYQRELSDLSQDVLDEVRSAIMDGVELGDFLDKNKDNPYALQQLRTSMKAGVPAWMLAIPYPGVLRSARKLYFEGVSLDSLKRLVDEKTASSLSENYWSAQTELIQSGVVIPEWLKVEEIPNTLLTFAQWAVLNGRNVEGIVTRAGITPEYAMACLMIRVKGQDVTEFISNQWHFGVLEALETVASKPYYGHIVRLLDNKSLPETVTELIALGSKGFKFQEYDLNGFNGMQLTWIYEAHMEQLDFTKMLDTELSQRELISVYNDLYLKSKGTKYLL